MCRTVLGSAVTKLKLEQKQRRASPGAFGSRGVGSVWGSGSAGILSPSARSPGSLPGRTCGASASSSVSAASSATRRRARLVRHAVHGHVHPSVQVRAEGHGGRGERRRHARWVGRQPRVRGRGCEQTDARGAVVATFSAFVAATLESWLGATTQAGRVPVAKTTS